MGHVAARFVCGCFFLDHTCLRVRCLQHLLLNARHALWEHFGGEHVMVFCHGRRLETRSVWGSALEREDQHHEVFRVRVLVVNSETLLSSGALRRSSVSSDVEFRCLAHGRVFSCSRRPSPVWCLLGRAVCGSFDTLSFKCGHVGIPVPVVMYANMSVPRWWHSA